MIDKFKKSFLYFAVLWIVVTFPRKILAFSDKVSVSRSDVLNVAKEIHPPGCLDSRTADYCQLSTAFEVRGEIRDLLEQGMNKGQVIDSLVQKYGERILAAPTTEGFNIIPWVLPGVSVLLGSFLVGYLIYKWAKKKPSESPENKSQSPISEEDELQINEELKNWL
ncbi:cytochrome c-type biogenesis protein CcmH [Radiobacillus sp. PE A8.2]|uniref:cytochrome c-type biogenesis protein n=1 Tax=Radiobacillus sp. PE A8.2 TaxID=3380349 RepID=UPI00389008EF